MTLTKLGFVVLALCQALLSHAQTPPTADATVEFSPLYILKGYTIWMNGASGSLAFNATSWFSLAGDVGVYHGFPAESLTGETYIAGPRLVYRKLDRLVPFAQALFGGSHFSASTGGITGGGNKFAFSIGGGTDIRLGNSRKLAVRLQGDYFGIRSQGSITDSARLSIGIVYYFGKT
jgi:hypothetical protein